MNQLAYLVIRQRLFGHLSKIIYDTDFGSR